MIARAFCIRKPSDYDLERRTQTLRPPAGPLAPWMTLRALPRASTWPPRAALAESQIDMAVQSALYIALT